jgi:hypothetical protein
MKQGKQMVEEIVVGLLQQLSQWLSHHVMPSKVNVAYLTAQTILTSPQQKLTLLTIPKLKIKVFLNHSPC